MYDAIKLTLRPEVLCVVVWCRFAAIEFALVSSIHNVQSDLLWQPYVDPALRYSVLYPADYLTFLRSTSTVGVMTRASIRS
jgi:hypothetical protein